MSVTLLPMADTTFLFTSSLTYDEFVKTLPIPAHIMAGRRNEVRMTGIQQLFFTDYPEILHFVLVLNQESPDTFAILPIIYRIAKTSSRLGLRILSDEDDLSLLDEAVDNVELVENLEEVELPLLLIFDDEWQLQAQWGPRPAKAETYLDEWQERHPEYERLSTAEDSESQDEFTDLLWQLTYEMRVWYNTELNKEAVAEIYELLESLQEENQEESDDEE